MNRITTTKTHQNAQLLVPQSILPSASHFSSKWQICQFEVKGKAPLQIRYDQINPQSLLSSMSNNIYKLLNEYIQYVSPSNLPIKTERPTCSTITAKKDFCKVNDEQTEEMRRKEWTLGYKLSAKHQAAREKIVTAIIQTGRRFLQLKNKTIELSIRLFDLYCMRLAEGYYMEGKTVKMQEKGRFIFDKKQECQLAMIACTFSCSKYNEIYPPSLHDYIYIFNDKFERSSVIMKEIEIVQLTNFAYTISTISSWYEYYYDEYIPNWGVDCLIKYYNIRMEEVAKVLKIVAMTHDPLKENDIMQRVALVERTYKLLTPTNSNKTAIYQIDEQKKRN